MSLPPAGAAPTVPARASDIPTQLKALTSLVTSLAAAGVGVDASRERSALWTSPSFERAPAIATGTATERGVSLQASFVRGSRALRATRRAAARRRSGWRPSLRMPSPPAKLRSPAVKALAVARRRYVDVEPVAYVAMTARRAQRASGSVRIDGDRHSARQLPRAWRRRLPNSELQAGNLLASCATVTVFLTQPGSHSRERHIDLPSLVPKRRNKIRQITKHASACSMQGPRLNPRETNIISSDRESSYHISSYLMSSVKHTVAVSRNFEHNRGPIVVQSSRGAASAAATRSASAFRSLGLVTAPSAGPARSVLFRARCWPRVR